MAVNELSIRTQYFTHHGPMQSKWKLTMLIQGDSSNLSLLFLLIIFILSMSPFFRFFPVYPLSDAPPPPIPPLLSVPIRLPPSFSPCLITVSPPLIILFLILLLFLFFFQFPFVFLLLLSLSLIIFLLSFTSSFHCCPSCSFVSSPPLPPTLFHLHILLHIHIDPLSTFLLLPSPPPTDSLSLT